MIDDLPETTFDDDPARDYRRRYLLPDQFLWDEAAWPRIDFDGYVGIAAELLPEPPGEVLDVGCGPGAGSARLAALGYRVSGVDYNARAVAFARLMVPGATFVEGDIRALGDLGGLEGVFEAAWCVEVLEHVPPKDRRAVFVGIARRLTPGGVLVITTPAPRMYPNPWDYPRAGLADLRSLLEEAGFRVTDVRFQHRLTPWFSPRAWKLLSNRLYDLRFARMALRRLFLRKWNVATTEMNAGRYVIRAKRVSG
jgi:2-polyprenyl-3-methyl-5-hydroxy-6-metoxy-1,4-benzoquinol methylase